MALQMGVRPRAPRHDSGSLVHPPALRNLAAVHENGRNRNGGARRTRDRSGDFAARACGTGSKMTANLIWMLTGIAITAPWFAAVLLIVRRRAARIIGVTASLVSVAASVLLLLTAPSGE